MNDGKIIRLTGYLLLSVIGFLLSVSLIFVSLRLFFGLLSYIPWLTYIYVLFILSVPAAVFTSVFIIYFRRTRFHPGKVVKYISKALFIAFIAAWAVVYVLDIISFYKTEKADIENYLSYNTLFLTINVTTIFLIGVMQALTTSKEPDWMDKHKTLY